ncbi:MAG: hypothetical protein GY906_10595 [bacterium]|nr:hypothetical protein [bacterium]
MPRSRREFLTGWFDRLRETTEAATGKASPIDLERALRPPGAIDPDDAFLEACTSCMACAEACPTSSLVAVPTPTHDALPVLVPSRKPCYLCDGLPCVTACEDGALVQPTDTAQVRIGLARVNPNHCITFCGEICNRCFKACPFPNVAIMQIGGRPLVMSGGCTGCGLCEFACPTEPRAIQVVPEKDMVPGLRIPKDEMQGG